MNLDAINDVKKQYKKLETKYKITKELTQEAYPDIQWGNRS